MLRSTLVCFLIQACQNGATNKNGPYRFSLGSFKTADWAIHSLSPLHFSIDYTNGDNSDIPGTDKKGNR